MLLQPLTHPQLVGALAAAGHGSRILIADGNYPVASASSARAEIIYLNLRPGLIDAVSVLRAIQTAVPIEAATLMTPSGADPDLFQDFAEALPSITFSRVAREQFYDECRSDNTIVVIATAETSHYGNLLLTIGVVPMETN